MSTTPIEQAVEVLNGAKSDAVLFLSGYPGLSARVNQSLTNLVNVLQHTAGISVAGSIETNFPPITNFLGETLSPVKTIAPSDVIVEPNDKEIYKEKVNALYDEFLSLDDAHILQGGNVDKLVLRGVAKVAGVENFQDADLDFEFLAAIRTAIIAKNAVKKVEAAGKKAAGKKKAAADKTSEPESDDDEDESNADPF